MSVNTLAALLAYRIEKGIAHPASSPLAAPSNQAGAYARGRPPRSRTRGLLLEQRRQLLRALWPEPSQSPNNLASGFACKRQLPRRRTLQFDPEFTEVERAAASRGKMAPEATPTMLEKQQKTAEKSRIIGCGAMQAPP